MAFNRDFGDRPARRNFPPREMIKGNWKCSECAKEITELPFEPAADRPIYCRDCWAAKRTDRFQR
jgi:CxxC-x17-CxxC domain-containing protein